MLIQSRVIRSFCGTLPHHVFPCVPIGGPNLPSQAVTLAHPVLVELERDPWKCRGPPVKAPFQSFVNLCFPWLVGVMSGSPRVPNGHSPRLPLEIGPLRWGFISISGGTTPPHHQWRFRQAPGGAVVSRGGAGAALGPQSLLKTPCSKAAGCVPLFFFAC